MIERGFLLTVLIRVDQHEKLSILLTGFTKMSLNVLEHVIEQLLLR